MVRRYVWLNFVGVDFGLNGFSVAEKDVELVFGLELGD